MAAVMSAPPQLAPRPIASWNHLPIMPFMDAGKENRPAALKQLQQSAAPARSRRERPCDGCRRRKSKCVLQDDRRCVLCEFHKQECTFVEKALPRKRKLEDGSTPQGHAKRNSVTTVASATSSNVSSQARSGPRTPALATSAPIIPPSGDRKPFAVDQSLSLRRHHHCKLVGQTTALDSSLLGLGTFNASNETECKSIGTLRQVTSTEYFSTHADADVPLPDDEARALTDIEAVIGPYGPALIDIYFRNVHPSFPILQKQAFMDRHRHGDKQFNPPLLAAMYLLALCWWDTDADLSRHPKPDMNRLEYIAISSLTIAMQRPKMSAVQAGLLLLQRAKSSTWTLTVQLVALGQDIGLHLDCTDWRIPLWERRLRKRLAWALYMQDKWSALMHGRPSHIHASDFAVRQPTTEDFDDAISPDLPTPEEEDGVAIKGRMVFMQMISLTRILAEVSEVFYSQAAVAEFKRAGKFATQLVLSRAKPVQLRLREWFARLPRDCKMEGSISTSTAESPGGGSAGYTQGYLHLAYFATEISIHRRIITSLCPDPCSSHKPPVDPYMLYICRSAAKTRLISAMDFVNRLTPRHLEASWYFPSASNFVLIGTFGALLMATSPGREEAGFYEARLREFRWTLGVCGRRAAWVGDVLSGLEVWGDGVGRAGDSGIGRNGEGGIGVGGLREREEKDRWFGGESVDGEADDGESEDEEGEGERKDEVMEVDEQGDFDGDGDGWEQQFDDGYE
ncbi:hypothetical protein EJ03DRAFT_341794 [Teratosphaeria nubilosa]|uniref:Zn(2)-C6 fungal-type domain-containing protein n=1 Tax=Teratosphaeria nubilosa TaxID=161662 RepID=A0A6G1LHI3_9PEZI|nr:hypothetical protein EJ03DRAFT_341794 [Teratosphaeria nubilosa]